MANNENAKIRDIMRTVECLNSVITVTEWLITARNDKGGIVSKEVLLSYTFDISDMPSDIDAQARVHGYIQKIQDVTAGMSEKKGFTPEQRREAMTEVYNNLRTGNWNTKRESTASETKAMVNNRESAITAFAKGAKEFEVNGAKFPRAMVVQLYGISDEVIAKRAEAIKKYETEANSGKK